MRALRVLLLCTASAGCLPSPTLPEARPAGGGSGTGGGTGACIDPGSCGSGGGGAGGGGAGGGGTGGAGTCGAQTFPLGSTKVAPNIFFVVDASGSMASAPPFGDYDPTKWIGLQTALGNVLDAHTGEAQYGLSIYPSGNNTNTCQPGQVDIPVAASNEAAIKARINGISAQAVYLRQGLTPTASTMEAAASVGGLKDATRPNYVVLMTDGQPNCESSSQPNQGAAMSRTVNAIAALFAAPVSVKTYVIGFGDVNTSSPDYLNAFADAGHTARAGAVRYYPAANAVDLEHAFDQIVAGVASCEYQLDMPPADPALVAPSFDGQPVAQSTSDGFTYDAATRTVRFHGTSCDRLKSGMVMKVEFTYGCPAPQVL